MFFLKNAFRENFLIFATLLLGFLFIPGVSVAQEERAALPSEEEVIDTLSQEKVIIHRGDLVELRVYGMTRMAIVDSGIFEVIDADVNKILVIGNAEGETAMFLWDSKGKRKLEIQVIGRDLNYIMARIQELFDRSEIKGLKLEPNALEGKIVLSGTYPQERASAVSNIITKYADYLIDVSHQEKKLIEIDVQIVELNTSLVRALGVKWTPNSMTYTEELPTWQGDLGDFFKIGDFTRTTALTATVNMLIAEGKGRVLSRPNVVVTDGQDASFLVGGEIPISTTTSTTIDVAESISYKSYGIDLTVTPKIQDDAKIEISLSVSIRDVDGTIQGNETSFSTRSADTNLLLDDGQTIVLAGLMKQTRAWGEDGVPFLRKVPIIGILFRSRADPKADTEVIISLTPHVLPDAKAARESKKETVLSKLTEQIKKDSATYMKNLGEPETEPVIDINNGPQAEGQDVEGPKAIQPESVPISQNRADIRRFVKPFPDNFGPSAETPKTEKVAKADIQAEPKTGESAAPQPTPTTGIQAEPKAGEKTVPQPAPKDIQAEPKQGEPAAPQNIPLVFEKTHEGMLTQKTFPQIEDVSPILTKYVQDVQKKIAEAVSFPYEAKEKGLEGTVTLNLKILSNGKLNGITIKNSSGQEIFDKDAVNTGKIVAPFDPFPAEIDLEELDVTVPVSYSQKAVFKELGEEKK